MESTHEVRRAKAWKSKNVLLEQNLARKSYSARLGVDKEEQEQSGENFWRA
jgi:hypothetical protein